MLLLVSVMVAGRLSDRRLPPPPGARYAVAGTELHLDCAGERRADRPTVVVEAGHGDWSLTWRTVQAEVQRTTRICLYDRAGYGYSLPGMQPRSGEQIVAELNQLMTTAGESPPYLLVGHSLGGQYARLYQLHYPDDVAALLLVDSRPPDFASSLPATVAEAEQRVVTQYTVGATLARLNLLRPLLALTGAAPHALGSEQERQLFLNQASRPAYMLAARSEIETAPELEATLRRVDHLGDLPLIVVTHDPQHPLPLGADSQAAERVWQQLQQALAEQSTNGRLIVATGSGHNIHLERPQLLADLIVAAATR